MPITPRSHVITSVIPIINQLAESPPNIKWPVMFKEPFWGSTSISEEVSFYDSRA